MTTHIQGIGEVNAKLGQDIKIGDVLVWNYGYTSTVKGIASETKSFITFILVSKSGISERRMKKSAEFAVK